MFGIIEIPLGVGDRFLSIDSAKILTPFLAKKVCQGKTIYVY